ncbi:DUF937 domain-containing protein [Nonomuraea maritima]|nr:DUF937 domain-containing protein [Nonomuraea maritima]
MTLHDELLSGLGDSGMEQIAGMLGSDTPTARQVLEAVTGAIVGGMARNAEHPDGADALRGALDDHTDTDPFNADVASLTRDGHSILGHVLGGHGTEHVAAGIARHTGVGTGPLMKLMPLIAPMVMCLLADHVAGRDMDAATLAEDLAREEAHLPPDLAELVDGLLNGIFGTPQAGAYDPFGGPERTGRQAIPGTRNRRW